MSASKPPHQGAPLRHMLRGSVWTVAVRWSLRLMGLASTVILARLLTPTDFGIASIAVMIVGMVEVFNRTGQSLALIRLPNPTRDDYDSAWTVSVLLGLALGLIVWALTPITSAYFNEPRVELVVEILALRTVLSGCRNIGIVNFQRNLQFDKQFWFKVIPTIISFPVTIIAAFVLRNYWALVIGVVVEHVSAFVLSYVMEPYRPRFGFKKVREIWSFSFWTLLRNIGHYLNTMVDRVAVGGFGGAAAMGRYYVATDVAISPTQELVEPVVSVLFPVMAGVQDKAKRRELYLSVLAWSALICTSTAIGVALVSDDMVDLVLGPQWGDVKPLIPWLALSYGILGLGGGAYAVLEAIGQPVVSTRLQWTRVLALALAVFPVAYYSHSLELVAVARFAVAAVLAPTLFLALMAPFDLRPRDFVIALWRPLTAGATMAAVVLVINATIGFSGNLRLLIDIAAGGSAYLGTLLLLWQASGKPEGPERSLVDWVGTKLRVAELETNRGT